MMNINKILVASVLWLWASCTFAEVSGERLAYVVGCISCHHQTPKGELNAPTLLVVQTYSLPEFSKLIKTGVTRNGRDMLKEGSLMGVVATEQLSYLSDEEIKAIYTFLQKDWTQERIAREEAKVPSLYKLKDKPSK